GLLTNLSKIIFASSDLAKSDSIRRDRRSTFEFQARFTSSPSERKDHIRSDVVGRGGQAPSIARPCAPSVPDFARARPRGWAPGRTSVRYLSRRAALVSATFGTPDCAAR